MRNLNECQAEVFRRSEERINARKRHRKQLLTACIPLVLCVTLFSIFLLPETLPNNTKGSDQPEAAVGSLKDNENGSLSHPVLKITVSGLNLFKTYTDPSAVLRITDQLCSYETTGDGALDKVVTGTTDDASGSIADSANAGYTVTLVMHDGSKAVYHLWGNTLKNLSSNRTQPLSQNQADELKKLLGISQSENTFKKPPKGTLLTPDGEAALCTGGYNWFCRLSNGLAEATNADQAERPLPQGSLDPVTINSNHAGTVYVPVPGSDTYAPTNALGYLLKLNWEATPSSVAYTCWPDTIWQQGNTPAESVVSVKDLAFYAKPGGYIYEIVATWDDTGAGYYGTANYYVYITGGNEVLP